MRGSAMNRFLRSLQDFRRAGSPANVLRYRRFLLLKSLFLEKLPEGARILDLGGTVDYWVAMGSFEKFRLTLLNLTRADVAGHNMESVAGDARHMPQFTDGEFDLVFSNSVIEHVGAHEQQLKMANEIRRVGKGYFLQTPSYWFPVEPHFLIPLFQFCPVSVRVAILRRVEIVGYSIVGQPKGRNVQGVRAGTGRFGESPQQAPRPPPLS